MPTFQAGNLLRGEAPAGEAQRVAAGVSVGLLHVQAHLGASCHCAPCMARHHHLRRACCPGPTQPTCVISQVALHDALIQPVQGADFDLKASRQIRCAIQGLM